MKQSLYLLLLVLIAAHLLTCQAVKQHETTAPIQETEFDMRIFDPFVDGVWQGQAISYGCYRRGQAPGVTGPSEAEILEDLKLIEPYWKLIRVYGSDADSERILKVIRQHQLPIRMLLGIWLENEINRPEQAANNLEQVRKGIELANAYPQQVMAINVGNESQVYWSGHRMAATDLIKYIRMVRNQVKQPVTTADDYNFWNKPESQELAAEIDFIVLHAYPLWNGISNEHALTWMDSLYNRALSQHPKRSIVVGETGWATQYDSSRQGPGEEGSLVKASVSISDQDQYLLGLREWSERQQICTFVFEAFDESWKGGGDATPAQVMEKHWGIFDEHRRAKGSFLQNIK